MVFPEEVYQTTDKSIGLQGKFRIRFRGTMASELRIMGSILALHRRLKV